MKFIDEYRDIKLIRILSDKIRNIVTRPWRIMEVCGSQTHTIMKYSLEQLLPADIELLHGPGCPVCVTPAEMIDKAIQLSKEAGVIVASYGDMLRVPGTNGNLLSAKDGDNIRVIYSPLDSVRTAQENPERTVVFFAIGFETTAPGNANAIIAADKAGLKNFLVLSSQVLIPPAIRYILSSGRSKVQALLAPGHVCAITGSTAYRQIADNFKVPIVTTGFEPVDILEGIYLLVKQLEAGKYEVDNQYKRVVTPEGNLKAMEDMFSVFEAADFNWRGIGVIPNSGLKLKSKFEHMNADLYYNLSAASPVNQEICIAGDILQGLKKPEACPSFSVICNPLNPVGAPMVSAEGICAAYFRYKHSKSF